VLEKGGEAILSRRFGEKLGIKFFLLYLLFAALFIFFARSTRARIVAAYFLHHFATLKKIESRIHGKNDLSPGYI